MTYEDFDDIEENGKDKPNNDAAQIGTQEVKRLQKQSVIETSAKGAAKGYQNTGKKVKPKAPLELDDISLSMDIDNTKPMGKFKK